LCVRAIGLGRLRLFRCAPYLKEPPEI
jgi:hypothetical protein